MNTKTIDSAYAGSVYTLPLHRRIASWLHKLKPWIASLGLGLFIVKSAQVVEFFRWLL